MTGDATAVTPQDRLQPFLLDRLRDDQPESSVEGRDRRAFTLSRFREAVLRDLAWLLNAKTCRPQDGLGDFPLVERSVLNFGLADLTGLTASSVAAGQVEQLVRRAIEAFEPRIIRSTLTVRTVVDKAVGANGVEQPHVIALEIRGQVWAVPLPESLYVKTEVDLETGDYQLKEG